MAAHVRNQIRDAIVAAVSNLTTTQTRVYKTRVFAMTDDNIPGLTIYTENETSQDISLGFPRLQRRTVTGIIEAYGKLASGVEDQLDTICKEVEIAIAADPTLGGKCKEIHITQTDIKFDDLDKAIGCAALTWQAWVDVKETDPSVQI